MYYVIRRVLYVLPIALGVSIICFALVLLAPGDPVQSLLPPGATAADAEYLRRIYGFDQPIPIQYFRWLSRAITGDLGISIQTGRPVVTEVANALSNTLILAVGATLVAFPIAIALGVAAAYFVGGVIDRIATTISIVGVSLPSYWVAIVLIIVFAVELGVLPATGMGTAGSHTFSLTSWEQIQYAILPIASLSLVPLGIIARNTRSAVAEILALDFIDTLRAKGLGELAVVRHALRNALPNVFAIMGLQFGYLVGGSILVETIFTWPGSGFLMNKAILTRDLPLLQGSILILALFFVTINLVIDLLQVKVDPRISRN